MPKKQDMQFGVVPRETDENGGQVGKLLQRTNSEYIKKGSMNAGRIKADRFKAPNTLDMNTIADNSSSEIELNETQDDQVDEMKKQKLVKIKRRETLMTSGKGNGGFLTQFSESQNQSKTPQERLKEWLSYLIISPDGYFFFIQ